MSITSKPIADHRPTTHREPSAPPLAAPRARRRPVSLVVSVAAVVLGSLVAWWAWTSTSATTDVVAVRALVHRGQVIDRADLMVVRVGVDPAVRTVPGSRLEQLVGQRAALDLAAGGLLAPDAVAPAVLPARGMSVVGVALPVSLMPAEPLTPGDVIRLVQTPGPQGEATGSPATSTATVVGVHAAPNGDLTIVDVLVPESAAAAVAERAATGRVALVLDSRER